MGAQLILPSNESMEDSVSEVDRKCTVSHILEVHVDGKFAQRVPVEVILIVLEFIEKLIFA